MENWFFLKIGGKNCLDFGCVHHHQQRPVGNLVNNAFEYSNIEKLAAGEFHPANRQWWPRSQSRTAKIWRKISQTCRTKTITRPPKSKKNYHLETNPQFELFLVKSLNFTSRTSEEESDYYWGRYAPTNPYKWPLSCIGNHSWKLQWPGWVEHNCESWNHHWLYTGLKTHLCSEFQKYFALIYLHFLHAGMKGTNSHILNCRSKNHPKRFIFQYLFC